MFIFLHICALSYCLVSFYLVRHNFISNSGKQAEVLVLHYTVLEEAHAKTFIRLYY
jgi:hypothetical protein